MSAEALAPFASLALPTSDPPHLGGPLHFVVTTRDAQQLYGCALAFAEASRIFAVAEGAPAAAAHDSTERTTAPSTTVDAPREVLLLLGQRYLPRASAACAHALLPRAMRFASASLPVDTSTKLGSLRAAALELLAQVSAC